MAFRYCEVVAVALVALQCSAAVALDCKVQPQLCAALADTDQISLLQVRERVEHRAHISATAPEFHQPGPAELQNLVALVDQIADLTSSIPANLTTDANSALFETFEGTKEKVGKSIAELEVVQSLAHGSPAPAQQKKCLDAQAWFTNFNQQYRYGYFSQGDQDSILESLFSADHLGTTNKQFVEFGFPTPTFKTSFGNGRYLRAKLGFEPILLLDGNASNPAINLHKSWITADNIVSLFRKFNVPNQPDYVSVDIDSCDLWVFHSITDVYRPRVVTVEYNSKYPLGDYTTLRCDDPTSDKAYRFGGDDLYGASLSALELAARHRGYSLVYASPQLDLFFVPNELLCPGTEVPLSNFAAATAKPLWGANGTFLFGGGAPPGAVKEYAGAFGPREELLMNFSQWMNGEEQVKY